MSRRTAVAAASTSSMLHCCRVQSALRLKPSFTDAYNNMASALVQKGLIPQAVECYNAALQINPNLVCMTAITFLQPLCLVGL